MTGAFYSDRVGGQRPRTVETITEVVWRGLVSIVNRRILNGSLAKEFPLLACQDGVSAAIGVDVDDFHMMLSALVPDLPYSDGYSDGLRISVGEVPSTAVALDLIDFVGQRVAEPSNRKFHDYWGHEHIWFDDESAASGGQLFREEIEVLFARNGVAFTIDDAMHVIRIGPIEAVSVTREFQPNTGDSVLDEMLTDAVIRFSSRDVLQRVGGLEKLWDAFERVKTLEIGERAQKSASIKQLIERSTDSALLRDELNKECMALTSIGNAFAIRHHEMGVEQLPYPQERVIDYLFTRLLSLMAYLLRQTGRL